MMYYSNSVWILSVSDDAFTRFNWLNPDRSFEFYDFILTASSISDKSLVKRFQYFLPFGEKSISEFDLEMKLVIFGGDSFPASIHKTTEPRYLGISVYVQKLLYKRTYNHLHRIGAWVFTRWHFFLSISLTVWMCKRKQKRWFIIVRCVTLQTVFTRWGSPPPHCYDSII